MILLDTDMMTTLHAPPSPARDRLVQRLETADAAGEEVAVSIVSFEEQMRGWMSVISRARDAAGQVPAYGRLRRLLEQYFQTLPAPAREVPSFSHVSEQHETSDGGAVMTAHPLKSTLFCFFGPLAVNRPLCIDQVRLPRIADPLGLDTTGP